MASLTVKETTAEKLDSIPFKAGQYIYVNTVDSDGNDAVITYYDSVIKQKRIHVRTKTTINTVTGSNIEDLENDEIDEFNNALWN